MSDIVSPAFVAGLEQLGLQLTSLQFKQLLHYRQELLDWNTRINLTAITDPEDVLIKHFLDSLSLLSVFDAPQAILLDIGSGAGFPGLVLKIVRPEWQIVSLEATGKKITFQKHIVDALGLHGIETIHARAEEIVRKEGYRGHFDVVIARAVAALPVLLEYAAPYCKVGGKIILPKKGDISSELAQGMRAATQLGAVLKEDVPVTLSGLDDGRRLLVWKQQKACPAQYPRASTVMSRKPL